MPSRLLPRLASALPPGLLLGLVLSLVQSLLIALVPVDGNLAFGLLLLLMLGLYLLVPLVARLRLLRQAVPAPDEARVALRIGLTCAGVVTIATGVVHAQAPAGGSDSALVVLLFSGAGLALALVGGWLGRVVATRRGLTPAAPQRARAVRRPLVQWLAYGLVVPVLLLSILLQHFVVALNPLGLLTILNSLADAPAFATNPYGPDQSDLRISCSSAPGRLYVGTIAQSYLLRPGDGQVLQRVSEQLVAGEQGVFFTSSAPEEATTIRARREGDGAMLWSLPLKSLRSAQVMQGILYLMTAVPGIAGPFLAVKAATGQILWQGSGVNFVEPPLLFGDRVVAWNRDILTAYRATDGHLLWQSQQVNAMVSPGRRAAPTERVGILADSGVVAALDVDTGALLWTNTTVTDR